MTYGEKYKTAIERTDGFKQYCKNHECKSCPAFDDNGIVDCQYTWLEVKVDEEKPMNCPYCGVECVLHGDTNQIRCCVCGYHSKYFGNRKDAIDAHNRLCKAVKAFKESKAK